jgi:hypothetical protein
MMAGFCAIATWRADSITPIIIHSTIIIEDSVAQLDFGRS